MDWIFKIIALGCLPVCGTDEGKGDELVPEGLVLRHGLGAHQSPEAGVLRQVTDLAGVGSHLSVCLSPLPQRPPPSVSQQQAPRLTASSDSDELNLQVQRNILFR